MRYTVFTVFCLLLLSCNDDRLIRRKNGLLMEQAVQLTETMPDSALILLDSVNTAWMNEAQYADFLLLRTRARSMADVDISADTAVYIAKRYFTKLGNTEKAAWANYYLGRIYLARREPGKALHAFNDTERQVKSSADNDYLKGLVQYYLGELHYGNDNYQNAVTCYRLAAACFNAAGQTVNEAGAYTSAGNAFLQCNQTDSALLYHNRAVALAETFNDSLLNAGMLMQNAGVTLMHNGEPGKAKAMFFRAIQQKNDQEGEAKIFLNLVAACLQMNQSDSAMHYMKKASELLEHVRNPETLSYAYHIFKEVEKDQGNYREALEFSEQSDLYAEQVFAEIENHDLAGEQKRYDAGVAQSERDRERMVAQNHRIIRMTLAISVMVSLILAGMLGLLARRLLKAKRTIRVLRKQETDFNKDIEQLNAKLANAHNEDEHQALLRLIADKEDSLYSCFSPVLMDRYQSIRKERRQNVATSDTGKQKKSEWDSFEKLMPNVLIEKIKQVYKLQNAQVKLCSLLYFDFRNSEIAYILDQTSGAVNVNISRVRSKLDIKEGGDVGLFLRHNLWITHPDVEETAN